MPTFHKDDAPEQDTVYEESRQNHLPTWALLCFAIIGHDIRMQIAATISRIADKYVALLDDLDE